MNQAVLNTIITDVSSRLKKVPTGVDEYRVRVKVKNRIDENGIRFFRENHYDDNFSNTWELVNVICTRKSTYYIVLIEFERVKRATEVLDYRSL